MPVRNTEGVCPSDMPAVAALLEAASYLLEQTVEMDLRYGVELTEGEKEAREQTIAALAAFGRAPVERMQNLPRDASRDAPVTRDNQQFLHQCRICGKCVQTGNPNPPAATACEFPRNAPKSTHEWSTRPLAPGWNLIPQPE